jgi:hypothetical protein
MTTRLTRFVEPTRKRVLPYIALERECVASLQKKQCKAFGQCSVTILGCGCLPKHDTLRTYTGFVQLHASSQPAPLEHCVLFLACIVYTYRRMFKLFCWANTCHLFPKLNCCSILVHSPKLCCQGRSARTHTYAPAASLTAHSAYGLCNGNNNPRRLWSQP